MEPSRRPSYQRTHPSARSSPAVWGISRPKSPICASNASRLLGPRRADVESLSCRSRRPTWSSPLSRFARNSPVRACPCRRVSQKTPAHLPGRGLLRPHRSPSDRKIDHPCPVGEIGRVEIPPADRSVQGKLLAPADIEVPCTDPASSTPVKGASFTPCRPLIRPGETRRSPPLSRVDNRELAPVRSGVPVSVRVPERSVDTLISGSDRGRRPLSSSTSGSRAVSVTVPLP